MKNTQKWNSVRKKWYLSLLLAVAVLGKLMFDYRTGRMDGLLFWTIIGIIGSIYLVQILAVIFPKHSKWLVGKRLFWNPFFAKNPSDAEKHIKQVGNEIKGVSIRYLKVYIILSLIGAFIFILLKVFGLI